MTLTTLQNLIGGMLVVWGAFLIVIAALLQRGKIGPNWLWGRSADSSRWTGIGSLAWGLGMLSHLVVPSYWGTALYIVGALIFTAATIVAAKKARAKS